MKAERDRSILLALIFALTLTLALINKIYGGDRKPVKPLPKDKCPVCGMFVSKYPDWVAQLVFKDGSYVVFDGAKDLFKYYFNLKRYHPSKKLSDIDSVYVMDYYDLVLIDGQTAYYVTGSDVYGPMGRELIPFAKEVAAKEFLKDHKGKSLLKFQDITNEVINGLD